MPTMDEYLRDAGSAEGEDLWAALRTQRSRLMEHSLSNRNLTVDMALFIARSKNSTAEILGALASDVRFSRSYKVMLALVKNARTPLRITNSLLKHIKIFDLADLTRSHFVHSVTRKKVELMLMERIPSLPAGVKAALSRRANAKIVVRIMERSDRRVIDTCLESARITEDLLMGVLQRRTTKPLLVRAIAEHHKWSLRYRVRYALVRNFHSPLSILQNIVPDMKVSDLRELYSDPDVPESVKPLIHSALLTRGKDVPVPEEEVYDLPEDADDVLSGDDDIAGMIEEADGPEDPDREDWELECGRSEPDDDGESGWELG